MYLDFTIPIPDLPGKIGRFKKGNTIYIRYVVSRKYHADRKYNIPNHKIIGKEIPGNPAQMIPNENFLKYFGDTNLPELKRDASRSSCLRIGAFLVIQKIMEDYNLPQMLMKYLGTKNCGLFLDLCAYSIICENNAGQYYPMYAYNHPLLTEKMHIYSDTKISDFFASITDDQSVGFLNEWNATRDHREKIYISYDSTNKNCQAGDIEMVEFGHAKDPRDLPIFNYAVAYDTNNREPLFYEQYPGSIVDISQLQFMLEKARGYGYKRVGFILDRGYLSKENIKYMDRCGYDFVIVVKGMASFVSGLILENKGTFENKRECSIRKYKTYGITIRDQLYASDEKERYFHLYYSDQKASAQREQVEAKINRMAAHLGKLKRKAVTIGEGYRQYFELFIHEEDGVFLFAKEKSEVIERERDLCGYFVIVTSKKMSAREARVQSDEAAAGKIFTEFIALIVRCRMYTLLKDELEKLETKPNYMTVPAAIRELKDLYIELDGGRYMICYTSKKAAKSVRQSDGWAVASIRDILNNFFNKDVIAGLLFNPYCENMMIVPKPLLETIMPGEKEKPRFIGAEKLKTSFE